MWVRDAHVCLCKCACRFAWADSSPIVSHELFSCSVGFAFHVWQEIFHYNDSWEPHTHTNMRDVPVLFALLCPRLLISPLLSHLFPPFTFHASLFPPLLTLCSSSSSLWSPLTSSCRCTIHSKPILKSFERLQASQMFCHETLFNLCRFETTRKWRLCNRQLACKAERSNGQVQGFCGSLITVQIPDKFTQTNSQTDREG